MQNIVLYANADSTLAYVTDSYGGRYENRVSFTRGFKATLVLRLLTGENGDPYPVSQLEQYTSWRCVFDVDYKQSTTPILSADSDAITVSGDGTVTEIRIPISNMNTNELADAILDFESLAGVTMELVGILPDGTDGFGLQIKGFTIRNRILYSGEPTEQEARFLDREQVLALVASGFDLQFSSDLVEWHETQTDADTHFRFRSEASETAAWSEPVMVPVGTPGEQGFSPTANVVKSDGAATITITDKDGTTTASVQDGLSPTAKVVKSEGVATITITDKDGTTTASVADGFTPTAKVEQVDGVTTITITDANGTTTASIQAGSGGSVDSYTKTEIDSMLTDYALKSDASTDHNHDSQYLKLSGGTLTGSLSATSIASTGSITEGGEALSSKYAAKSHSHAMSDVTGLQTALDSKAASSHTHAVSDVTGLQTALDAKAALSHTHALSDVTGLQDALDAKADAGSVPSSCVTYAETLPTSTDGAPGCVIVTGATSETQTRGHVYSLLRQEKSITRDLNVSFTYNTFAAGKFRVYGSGSCHANGGNLYEYDLAWISSTADSGTNVGEVILFKRKGSDTRWYLHGNNSDYVWRCDDDSCLNISDPLELSGMTFSNPESAMTTITITDAGTVSPTIDFTCRGETTNLYRVEDSNGKPKWLGKATGGGMAIVSLSWSYDKWTFSNNRDLNPMSVYINSTAASPLNESGKEWEVYEEYSGVIGNFPVTITEKPLPTEVSWSYEDITVQELTALRSSLTALEARVAALEASNSHEVTK